MDLVASESLYRDGKEDVMFVREAELESDFVLESGKAAGDGVWHTELGDFAEIVGSEWRNSGEEGTQIEMLELSWWRPKENDRHPQSRGPGGGTVNPWEGIEEEAWGGTDLPKYINREDIYLMKKYKPAFNPKISRDAALSRRVRDFRKGTFVAE